ncbi:YbaB/EbfC family nucleoid-associated protein [Nocardia terpenica]|uniref:YbaB/EbfC family DNA-binding protein n=1 Tax=Nocardia terpenica TaxID=455432 RepID=A0A291REJ2_9NOCA|nr:YbaB/EbfC family nucleoid-associated protein [Nocardia terpenica]ATL65745.1 hypothetical protein CRH09_05470 [Nocardia terpenica]
MTNEMAKAQAADIMDMVRAGIDNIARAQREQARLVASATAARGRVTVTVNAQGVVIETRFSSDIEDLGYAEIARAVTQAAQDAAAQVRKRTREIFEDVRKDQERMPRLSEFLPGMPDVRDMMPEPPEVSTAPPRSAERDEAPADGSMRFTDVEQWDHDKPTAPAPFAAERPW